MVDDPEQMGLVASHSSQRGSAAAVCDREVVHARLDGVAQPSHDHYFVHRFLHSRPALPFTNDAGLLRSRVRGRPESGRHGLTTIGSRPRDRCTKSTETTGQSDRPHRAMPPQRVGKLGEFELLRGRMP